MEAFLVNETSQDVFFDNFRVQSTPSITVQVMHYYPFGMEMPALAYQAGGISKNRYLYNQGAGEVTFDTERIPELNIDLTHFRAYDPTLGRWWQVDPLASEMSSWTPYNYSFNNPIRFNDPLGDYPTDNGSVVGNSIGQEQSEEWFGKQRSMYSNGGGGGIQRYLPSGPPKAKEGEKLEEKVNNDNTNGESLSSETLGWVGVGLGVVEEGAANAGSLVQRNMPILNDAGREIGNWRITSKAGKQALGYAKTGASWLGYGAAGLSVVIDGVDYNNGGLSGVRLSYRTGVTVVGLGIGYFSTGGLGALATGIGILGEHAYDAGKWLGGEISNSYWEVENAMRQGWVPFR